MREIAQRERADVRRGERATRSKGAEDHVEREYWRLIADHWLELLRASAGDNDDQIQLKERAVVRLGIWRAVSSVRSCHQLGIEVTALRQQPEDCQRDNAAGGGADEDGVNDVLHPNLTELTTRFSAL
jgi:hypothetical protein